MNMIERIKEVLKINNQTDEYISQSVEVSTDTIYRIKTGSEPPSIEFMEFLVREHPNLNLNWLVLGEGDIWTKTEIKTPEQIRIELIEKRYMKLEKMYHKLEKDYNRKAGTIRENKRRAERNRKSIDKLEIAVQPFKLTETVEKYKYDNPDSIESNMKRFEKAKKNRERKSRQRIREESAYRIKINESAL